MDAITQTGVIENYDAGVCFVYGDQGWMSISGSSYKTYFGPLNEPGPAKSESDFQPEERSNGWKNLVDCVRSGQKKDLDKPMIEGHLSASLCHLGRCFWLTRMNYKYLRIENEKFNEKSISLVILLLFIVCFSMQ